MANFKICIRNQNRGGLFPVYIRITHKRKIGYIKTDKYVSKAGVKKGEVIDPVVLVHCSQTIIRYNESFNLLNLDSMTVADLVRHLRSLDEDISFSEYAQKYIKRMAQKPLDLIERGTSVCVHGRLRCLRYTGENGESRTSYEAIAASVNIVP